MKKRFAVFCFVLMLLGVFSSAVFAGAEDVELIPLSRYNYKNVDGYGFYDKCGDSSAFNFVLHNPTDQDYTVTLPETVHVTGWYGTEHGFDTFTRKHMDYGNGNFARTDREEIPFEHSFTLQAQSTWAIASRVRNFEKYNLYWDTDVFFKVDIDGVELPIQGKLAQRGNACSADQVCSAEVLSGSYYSDGTGGVISVRIKNAMPDGAEINPYTKLGYSGVDAQGAAVSGMLEDAVAWTPSTFWLPSGEERTISGAFTLPVSVSGVNKTLDITAYFMHPSSLFFGDFQATGTLSTNGGAHGVLTGTYRPDGSTGTITAVFTNDEDTAAEFSLSSVSLTGEDSSGKTVSATIQWNDASDFTLSGHESIQREGTFTFGKGAAKRTAANRTMDFTTTFTQKDSGTSYYAKGTLNRDKPTNPTISARSFCRDYELNSNTLTFVYSLTNNSDINISVSLAGTLAVDTVVHNPSITYTECLSSGESCGKRIKENNQFVIYPGETVSLAGKVQTETALTAENISVRTSLLYYPEDETVALYVGKATDSCSAEGPLVPENTATPQVPEETAAATATATPEGPLVIDETETPVIPTATGIAETPVIPTATGIAETPVNPTATGIAGTPVTPTVVHVTEVPTATAATEMPVEPTATVIPSATITPDVPAELESADTAGAFQDCCAATFDFTLKNVGVTTEIIDLSRWSFVPQGSSTAVPSPQYTACRTQSGAGVDLRCDDELASGMLTLYPGTLMTISVALSDIHPEGNELILDASTSQYQGLGFVVTLSRAENGCGAEILFISDSDEKPLEISVAQDGSNKLVITLTLANTGNEDAIIILKNIYLHNAAVTAYSGIGFSDKISSSQQSKGPFIINAGESVSLKAGYTTQLTLEIPYTLGAITSDMLDINWNLTIGNQTYNVLGEIAASQLLAASTPTPTPTPQNTSVPVSTFTPVPTAAVTVAPTATEKQYSFFLLEDEPQLGSLPATGFSGDRSAVLESMDALRVPSTVHLQIPSINSFADVVPVAGSAESGWQVELLGDQVGLLDTGVKAGEGTTVIAGHNHLDATHTGPFLFLQTLQEGDRIFLTEDEGAMRIYSVYANRTVDPSDSNAVFAGTIPGSLVLVTCESELPEGGYAYRRLIFAEPLQ